MHIVVWHSVQRMRNPVTLQERQSYFIICASIYSIIIVNKILTNKVIGKESLNTQTNNHIFLIQRYLRPFRANLRALCRQVSSQRHKFY